MSEPRTRRLAAGMVGGGAGADIGKTHRYAMRLDDRYVLDGRRLRPRPRDVPAALAAALGRLGGAHLPGLRGDGSGRGRPRRRRRRRRRRHAQRQPLRDRPHASCSRASPWCARSRSPGTPRPPPNWCASPPRTERCSRCRTATPPTRWCAQAARMVRDGGLGTIRSSTSSTPPAGRRRRWSRQGHKQAAGARSRHGRRFPSVVGDLGTHAYHLLRYITGLDAERVSGRSDTLVPGRRVFDNATVRLG